MIRTTNLMVNISGNNYYVRVNDAIASNFEGKMNRLIYDVCQAGDIPICKLKTRTRKREVVICRQIISYIAYRKNYGSYLRIGLFLGGYDHSTILHGVRCVEQLLEINDTMVLNIISQLRRYL